MAYSKDYYQKWYKNKRSTLSETRKKRYQSDPVYREKAKAASTRQQQKLRDANPRPKGCDFTLENVAYKLHVSIWTLRAWRKKNYFPEPAEWGGRRYLSHNQVLLLTKLAEAITPMKDFSSRVNPENKKRRDDRVSWVFANWNS